MFTSTWLFSWYLYRDDETVDSLSALGELTTGTNLSGVVFHMIYFFGLVVTEIYSGCFVLDKTFVTIFTPFDKGRNTESIFNSMINNDNLLSHRDTITLNLIEESNPEF